MIFEKYDDLSKDVGIIENCFKKDVIWSIAGGLTQEGTNSEDVFETWTGFYSSLSSKSIIKAIQDYLRYLPNLKTILYAKNILTF